MNKNPTQLQTRSQRPTKLLAIRNRSESPLPRSKSRPNEYAHAQNGCESSLFDLETLQMELERRSGMLDFGVESIVAKMEDFVHEGLLGMGTCSVVYKMRHRLRPEFVMAVKYMRRTSTCPEENKRILMDLNVVTKSYDCSNIVKCFGIFFTTGDVWICMEVMPTCLDKLSRDLSRPFPERVIGKITVAITTALDYLKRKHNVMHRDVKPSNMLLSYDGVVKLCDFGISGMLKDSIARSRQLGCIGYMSPERLTTPTYDVRADIWSLGISVFELATGSFPYKGTEIEFAIMSKIISDPPPALPHHIPFTNSFRNFVDCCLKKDYKERPKYRSLMSMDFFCRYDVPPYDVLDWLQGLPLDHLHHKPHDYNMVNTHTSPSCNSISSANSVTTLSPVDNNQALSNLSLEDSVELNKSGDGQGAMLKKPTVSYASAILNKPVRPPRATQLKCVERESISLLDPLSQGSSGYGSAPSESSPRLLSKVQTSTTGELDKNKNNEQLNGGGNGKIKWNGHAVNNSIPVSHKNIRTPLANGMVRRLVSEYPEQSSVHFGSVVTHPIILIKNERSELSNGVTNKPATCKTRSASVGAHLHRSHAQRWPSRPDVVSKNVTRRISQPVQPNGVSATVSTDRQFPDSEIAPQQYHHHYFEYYHRPPRVEKKPPVDGRPLVTRHASLDARNNSTLNSSRLTQRLPTYPLPRNCTSTKIPTVFSRNRAPNPILVSTTLPSNSTSRVSSNYTDSRVNSSSSSSNQSTYHSKLAGRHDLSVQETDI